ncbi:hypothetical protein H632_c1389p0, partial [Helicosporidium sp. ATCC 50920]
MVECFDFRKAEQVCEVTTTSKYYFYNLTNSDE